MKITRRTFIKGLSSLLAIPALAKAAQAPAPAPASAPQAPVLDKAKPFELHDEQDGNWLNRMLNELLAVYQANLFEVNDSVTRDQTSLRMSEILSAYGKRGKLYSFAIACNESNNPMSVVDDHDLRADVRFVVAGTQVQHSVNFTSNGAYHVTHDVRHERSYGTYYLVQGPIQVVQFPDGYQT